MIKATLEKTLHNAFVDARKRRHEFISVEHLLLALLNDDDSVEVIKACGGSIKALELQLSAIVDVIPGVPGAEDVDTQPTLGFQRVIQRAIMHVQSTTSSKEVSGANCLLAIFGEKDSIAVGALSHQGITRLEVVNFMSHGIRKEKTSQSYESQLKAIAEKSPAPLLRSSEAKEKADSPKDHSRKLFISYCHVDAECVSRLLVHLKPLERDKGVICWSDKNVRAGDKWKREIQSNLEEATVAILLISADFLASDFIVNNELPPLLIKAESMGLRIIPVILKPCGFKRDKVLQSFQCINDPLTPLLGMNHIDQEALYDRIAGEVMAEIEMRQTTAN